MVLYIHVCRFLSLVVVELRQYCRVEKLTATIACAIIAICSLHRYVELLKAIAVTYSPINFANVCL